MDYVINPSYARIDKYLLALDIMLEIRLDGLS